MKDVAKKIIKEDIINCMEWEIGVEENIIRGMKKYHQSRLSQLLQEIEELYTGDTSEDISKVRERDKERIQSIIQQHIVRPVDALVSPPLSVKAKRTMPVEIVSRKEYEEIRAFYLDVYNLIGKMNHNPEAKNVNDIFNRAKNFVEKHEY